MRAAKRRIHWRAALAALLLVVATSPVAMAKAGPAAGAAGSGSPLLATVDVGLDVDVGGAGVELALEAPRSWAYLENLDRPIEGETSFHSDSILNRTPGGSVSLSQTRVWDFSLEAALCAWPERSQVLADAGVTAELARSSRHGVCFALNNPVNFSDPMGLCVCQSSEELAEMAAQNPLTPEQSAEFEAITGEVYKGIATSPWRLVKGGYQVVRHPIQSGRALVHVATHPFTTAQSAYWNFSEASPVEKGRMVGSFYGDFLMGAGVGKAVGTARSVLRFGDELGDAAASSITDARMSSMGRASAQGGETASDLAYAREILEEASQSAGLNLGDLVDDVAVSHGPSQFFMNRSGQLTLNLNRGQLLKGHGWALRDAYHELAHAQLFDRIRVSKFRGKRGAAWRYVSSSKRRFGSSYYAREELVADRYARWMLRQHHGGASPQLGWSIQQYLDFWQPMR